MKPRHAAALALVGWYLMVPPYDIGSAGKIVHVNLNAPLSRWFYFNESLESESPKQDASIFSSKEQCEIQRSLRYLAALDPSVHDRREIALDAVPSLATHAICISTDDPRLKSN